MRRFHIPATALAAALALAGCAGGGSGTFASKSAGGSTAGTASPGGATGSLTVRVVLPSSGLLPLFTQQARRDAARLRGGVRRPLSVSLGSVAFQGTLYPGYAGATPVSTTLVQNTSSLPTSVSLGFNNVPAGNNEWVVVNVVGYDSPNATGSNYVLGQLAGFASVGTPPALASIDTNSTLRFQVALAAMQDGIISTYDLQNTSALDANIGGFITGTSPNPATGLFTSAQLVTFDNGLYPIFSRTLVVTGTIVTPSTAAIVYDYRQSSENDFVANVDAAAAALQVAGSAASPADGAIYPLVYGSPFYQYVSGTATPPHTPPSGQQTADAQFVDAVEFAATSGSVTLQHVYGGNLIVGMDAQSSTTTPGPPFYGGSIGVGGRPQNDTTTATIPIGNATVNMAFVDPQWAAFGARGEPGVYPTNETFDYECTSNPCPYTGGITVTGTSSTEVTVSVDAWNPWGVPASGLDICTGIDCFPLSNGTQDTSRSPFFDAGTDLPYYNWQPNGGAVTSIVADPGFYVVNYSGGTSGYIKTTTPAWFFPAMQIYIDTSAARGTTMYLVTTCPTGTFQNSGVVGQDGYAEFVMTSITSTVQCSATQIGFGLPPGSATSGSFDIGPFGYGNTLYDGHEF
jgi:hypothetical protein